MLQQSIKSKAAKAIALGSAIYLARLAYLAIIIDHIKIGTFIADGTGAS